MNEISLINTAKIRWLKSQEILQILKDPPKGLIVEKIPTKPQNGDIFILDSKIIKRKWKQDGWTYMPRKQGIGFREDNENLRIGGENAITCYYSYIINGLLEGEEKIIVMNRRIYKLFPDGQYFFVHYLKDTAGASSNSVKETSLSIQSSSGTSIQSNQQQIQSSNSVETDYQDIQKKNLNINNQLESQLIQEQQQQTQNNQASKEEFLQQKKDFLQRHLSNNNNILNSTTISATSDLECSSKEHPFHLNDYTLFNQEESSYYSNSSPVCSTNQIISQKLQENNERYQLSGNTNKSQFSLSNCKYPANQQQKTQLIQQQNINSSAMEEENDQIVKNQFETQQNMQIQNQNQQQNKKIYQQNIPLINQCKNNTNNPCEFYNILSQDGEYDLKLDINSEGHSANHQIPLNINYTITQQIQQAQQNNNYNDLEDWQHDQYSNTNNQQQYKGNYDSYQGIDRSNQIQNRNHEFQQLDLERNFDEMIQYGEENFRNTDNSIQQNVYEESEYINRNTNLQNTNGATFIKNYQTNIYESQKQSGQFPSNSTMQSHINQQNNSFQINQENQVFQKGNHQKQSQIHSRQFNQIQLQQQQQIQKDNPIKSSNTNQLLNYLNKDTVSNQFTNPPSYSKLQERIIELEERLQKLEFGNIRQQTDQNLIESMTYPQNQADNNHLGIFNNAQNINVQNENNQKFKNLNYEVKNQSIFIPNQNQKLFIQEQQLPQLNLDSQNQLDLNQKILSQKKQQNTFYNNHKDVIQQPDENIQINQNVICQIPQIEKKQQFDQNFIQNTYNQNTNNNNNSYNLNNKNNSNSYNSNSSNSNSFNQNNNNSYNQNNNTSNHYNQNNNSQYNQNNNSQYNQNNNNNNCNQNNNIPYNLNSSTSYNQSSTNVCNQNNNNNNNNTYNENQIQEEGQKQITNSSKKNQQNSNTNQQNENRRVPIKVTEYSPEWDYTKGGSKMVLCFLPALSNLSEYQMSQFQIGFGSEKVPAYCIQPGVLKCFVPPHEKGIVKLQIYLEDQRIDCIDDKPSYFEFRNQDKKKKKQISKKVIFNQDDEFYKNEFKVRIIDKLNSIQDFISQSSNSKSNQAGFSNHVQIDFVQQDGDSKQKRKDLQAILESLRDSLDNLNNQNFNTLLTNILSIAEGNLKKNQIKKWIDQVDDNGYGLIHYVVILGFDSSFNILKEFDCNLNLQSKNKITPLQLAFALNQEKIVEILIKSGALGENLNQQLQGGQIKGDIQQISSLLNLGTIYQSRNILDMLVREVTLHDSINNSSLNDHISWNDQDEQEDNYLDIKDLCEPSNENDLIKNLNAISHQLKDLNKKKERVLKKKNNMNNQEGEFFSLTELEKSESYLEEDEEEDYDVDDYDDEDDEEEEDDDDDEDEYSKVFRPLEQNKLLSQDNLDKANKKHKYLRNYSEVNKAYKDKQRDATEFDEKDEQLYMSQNYQCRIKTIQKNVRGWLLRRQYLDIKYATRVLQNYIRQKIAKKHIKPECKNMIKNKLIDWLSIKH
ncbi:IQ calmodulin-binding motif protein, putative (macronuclear) [Tetrahymena thermophila SB210]|uniref:IQ calmodulin-binding motif protein, putative n=1 Tax=Tetrahymena thermophila (strain SB210) TaxID=312017 RepID=I7MDT8_TETTS|nr:IQ calmodulin-binding motif protein, putative [Tetrahymena thermophila SB210]EAR90936.2 IQ calmodulin-binding motif protein, putative [Tetrahymena thermophila SB210]|eukprot:XP_001011181.2 IQ calmodulin-binding motif protein, putative [Tetrahymena thermophila SB210]